MVRFLVYSIGVFASSCYSVLTPTARRSPSGTPLTFPNRTMTTPYRVRVMIDGQQVSSTLLPATSKAAAIAKAQQEPVTIRTTGRITYTAAPFTA